VTVTLELKPEVEAGLLARAAATGMDLNEYLVLIVEQAVAPPSQDVLDELSRQEAVRRMLEFGDRHRLRLGEPISRRVLHEGRQPEGLVGGAVTVWRTGSFA
jgi:hypothetical protein